MIEMGRNALRLQMAAATSASERERLDRRQSQSDPLLPYAWPLLLAVAPKSGHASCLAGSISCRRPSSRPVPWTPISPSTSSGP